MIFSQQSLVVLYEDDFIDYPLRIKSEKTIIVLFGNSPITRKILQRVSSMIVGVEFYLFLSDSDDIIETDKLVIYKNHKAIKYIPTDNLTVNSLIKYSLAII